MQTPQKAACTFTSHGENGFKCLHEFYRAKTLCDVKLKIGQKEIACHRLVLACWSTYFCAMFSAYAAEIDRFLCQNYAASLSMIARCFHSLSFEMLQSILKSDSLMCPTKCASFDSVVKWGAAGTAVRQSPWSAVNCQSDYLMDSVNSGDPLVHSQQACKEPGAGRLRIPAEAGPSTLRGGAGFSALPHYRPRKTYGWQHLLRWRPGHPERSVAQCRGAVVYAVGGHERSRAPVVGEMFESVGGMANRWSRMRQHGNQAARPWLWHPQRTACSAWVALTTSACFYTVERYNPVTDSWANVASMGSPRVASAAPQHSKTKSTCSAATTR
uniref:BTB domain-containing protein n=1 Tax=Macrostomum lignano TaxID=282301 RepID=A0A1I8F8P7_9PLAT